MNLNQVILIGRLVRDPELKALPSGTNVVNMSIATSRTWKDKNNAKQESVEFHNLVAFGKTADIIAQYLKKGQLVNVVGRLQTRSWDGKDGEKKYRTEIMVESMQMGPRAANATGGAAPAKSGETTKSSAPDTIEYPTEDINPEDIPF